MCRLAYIPANAKVSRKTLNLFFRQLERSFGGDGNGFAAVSEDGTAIIKKAVKLKCEVIAKQAATLNKQGYSIFFHTRKISIGWSSDEQCHPFQIKGPEFDGVLCHNGTWREGGILAKYLGTGSDTATFAHLIGQIGIDQIEQRELMPTSGVFLLHGGKPGESKTDNVLHLGGSLEYCGKTGIWASEFFREWPHYNETYKVSPGAHILNKPAPAKIVKQKFVMDEINELDQYWNRKKIHEELDSEDNYNWQGRHFYHN